MRGYAERCCDGEFSCVKTEVVVWMILLSLTNHLPPRLQAQGTASSHRQSGQPPRRLAQVLPAPVQSRGRATQVEVVPAPVGLPQQRRRTRLPPAMPRNSWMQRCARGKGWSSPHQVVVLRLAT